MGLYDNLLFMILLAAVLLPAAVFGTLGRGLKWYGFIATLLILLLVFDTWQSRAMLAGFYVLQLLTTQIYLQVREKLQKRWLLWIFVAVSLLPLLLVKFNSFAPGLATFRLLGVSYMTFRAVQVLIETYDGLIKDIKILNFSYFLLFFPSVSSGPIDRFRRFEGDITTKIERAEYLEMLKRGIFRLFVGALFNFVIGNIIWTKLLVILPDAGIMATLSYMYGYTFFLFFNFAGYSLMAIGSAYVLGVRLPENFDMPFLSRDMKDFWSRWHMSLSGWLRDYVYTRFVTAALKGEWFKDRRTASYIGYLLTMFTMGVWHGPTPAYLIYGAYHGVLMCANEVLDTRWKAFKKIKRNPVYEPLLILITFHLFSFGLLIFSGRLF